MTAEALQADIAEDATLHLGDCLEVLRTLPDCSADAVVTDPPYGLSFMGKKWDYDVPAVEVWAECLRVLKPGGHLLAFAGTRTQHRMAVRIEDAGFEIRDMIAWVYGSGFPKSLDVSKAIDKAAGAEREVVAWTKAGASNSLDRRNFEQGKRSIDYAPGLDIPVTAPATEAARQWQGWGTALKPALEPITVARKPLPGTVAKNVLAHGTGALNIDECRVDASGGRPLIESKAESSLHAFGDGLNGSRCAGVTTQGRWPANLIHDGSDEVVACFPANAGASAPVKGTEVSRASAGRVTGERDRVPGAFHADSGSAARFFYTAKAAKSDRDDGLDLRLPARRQGARPGSPDETGKFPDHDHRERTGNFHPTVKPTDLMRYLCRLVTPPGGTVLDPFMGSGSTGRAALLEGFRFIGIEREAQYLEIARARVQSATPALWR
jgi:site-specific DNA-methyltransferase (adenine-specific)